MTAKATPSTMAQPLTKKDRYMLALIDLCSNVPTSMFAKFDAKAFLKRHDVHPDFLMTLLERGYLFEKEGEYKQGVELRRVQSKEMIDWCTMGQVKPKPTKMPKEQTDIIGKGLKAVIDDFSQLTGIDMVNGSVSEPAILPISKEAKVVNIPDEIIDLLSTDMEAAPVHEPAVYYVHGDTDVNFLIAHDEADALKKAETLSREKKVKVYILKSVCTVECVYNYVTKLTQ